jgi:hypothetical protein
MRKCHEFETDLGAADVRQPRNRRSIKINMSLKMRPYTRWPACLPATFVGVGCILVGCADLEAVAVTLASAK